MVTLLLDSTRLEVVLSVTERALSLHRENVLIERAAITKVQLTDDAWTWLRGVASPGTHLPGLVAMGTWKSAGGDDFAVIRRRRPAVVIDLSGHPRFERVVLTTSHGVALAKALRLEDADDSEVARVVSSGDGDAPVEGAPAPAKKPRPRRAPKPATT